MLRRLLAVLVVAAVPVVGVQPALHAAAAADPGYLRVADLTFPVAGRATYGDSYHADRSGGARKHQATDIMAAKLQRVHAAVGGTVTFAPEAQPSWGWAIEVRGDDGLDYAYLHLNNDNPGTDDGRGGPGWAYAPGIRRGVRVERGQWIGYVGDSGNAEVTPAHLHFEMERPGMADARLVPAPPYRQDRINPFASLEAARRRGDVPAAPSAGAVQRLYGPDRVRSAVAISRTRGAARTVVIVPAHSPIEGLLAAPLAAALDAPVLLTGARGLDAATAHEVTRLGARNAYLIGDTATLHASTAAGLSAAGVTATARLAAPDRFALAAAVARELRDVVRDRGLAPSGRALLVGGQTNDPARGWADALSGSALAAQTRAPILLTRPRELPEATRAALAELRPSTLYALGSEVTLGEQVAALASGAAGATVRRLAGPDRYATSAAVARAGEAEGLSARVVWIANGRNYPGALAAGPAAARAGAPVLLVDGSRVSGAAASQAWLSAEASRLDVAIVVGAPSAVSDAVADRVARLIAP